MNIPERGPADPYGGRHVRKTAVHQYHIRAVDGNIRSRSDGKSGVRPCECGRIVDPVTHHCHASCGAKQADHLFLSLRQHTCHHMGDARFLCNGRCRPFIIPRQHDHFRSQLPQLPYRIPGIRPESVRHGNDPQQSSVLCEEEGRLSLIRQTFLRLQHPVRKNRNRADILPAASGQPVSLQDPGQAVSRQRPEFPDPAGPAGAARSKVPSGAFLRRGMLRTGMLRTGILRTGILRTAPIRDPGTTFRIRLYPLTRCIRHQIRFFQVCHHCSCQRMLAPFFQKGCFPEQFFLRHPICRNHLRHLRCSLRDRSRFIQNDDLRLPGGFQRFSCLKKDPVLCTHTVSNHDGYRRSQSQGTGTGDHQYGDSPGQCKCGRLSCDQPAGSHKDGDADHHRHKDTRHPVGDPGDGRFRRRRVRYHADDPSESRILPDPDRPAEKVSGLIDGCGMNRIIYVLIHRHRFPGQGRLIHRALSFQHHAVHRNRFAGPDRKEISHLYFPDRHRNLLSLPDQSCRLRCKAHQTFQGIRGTSLRNRLQ